MEERKRVVTRFWVLVKAAGIEDWTQLVFFDPQETTHCLDR